jgi:hypothetical protein
MKGMGCSCGGNCTGCLGAYTAAEFSYPGLRLRLPGGAAGAHGKLGIYRGPAEPPPNPNPGAGLGAIATPIFNYRYPPQPVGPEPFRPMPWGGQPIVSWPFPPQLPPTQITLQPPPNDYPEPSPVVAAPARCPSPNSYIDAAGNCTNDWHNPYNVTLQSPSPSPGAVIAAPTPLASTAAAAPVVSWFTDPNQELIAGFPNWGLIAAAVGAFMLMKGRR